MNLARSMLKNGSKTLEARLAPQNELRVVFAVAKTRFLEKKDFENICPTHIRSFFTSAVCSLPVSDLFVDRFS